MSTTESMTDATLTRVREIVEPIVADAGLELYDIERRGAALVVSVQRSASVDLAELATVSRAVSRALDEADPISGRYTLEVSSPGLERPLRSPAHFRGALGSEVAVKLTSATDRRDRRVQGFLVAADDDGIIVAASAEESADKRHIAYGDIDKARTTFSWGPAPRPVRNSAEPTKVSTR